MSAVDLLLSLFWSVIALAGACRAVYLSNESRKDRNAILPVGNGRLIVVTAELEHRVMGVFIYLSLLVPGLLSLGLFLGVVSVEARVSYAPVAAVLALVLLFFRQERDVVWLRRHWNATKQKVLILEDADKLDRIDENTSDTRRMVKETLDSRSDELDARSNDLDERARRLSERGRAQDDRGRAQDDRGGGDAGS